jgi:uncharacterized protein YbjT (DUF2867 family)
MPYVIAGVTGKTGKVVAETLLEQKQAVRVIVREAAKGEAWKARGAEVAVADLGDREALGRALQGAQGAYLLVPPSMTEPDFRAYQDRMADAIAHAVETSRVPHVVFLSSVAAQHPSGTGPIVGLHRAEAKLRASAAARSSFVRAGYFMENLAFSLGMLDQGILPSFVPAGLGIDMIATVDIGKLAAGLLVEGAQETRVIELGGPSVSMNDCADALGRITGKPVRVQEAPLEALVPTYTSFGMPEDVAELYREMTAGMISGHVDFEGGHRRVMGTTPVESVLRGLLG